MLNLQIEVSDKAEGPQKFRIRVIIIVPIGSLLRGRRRGIGCDKLVVSWGTSVLPARLEWVTGLGGWGGRGPDLSWLFSDTTPATRPNDRLRRIQMPIYFCIFTNATEKMWSLPPNIMHHKVCEDVCSTLPALYSLLSLSDSWLLSMCFLWALSGRDSCSQWGHYIEVHCIVLHFASWLLSMCFLWVAPERNFHWHWGHYVLWRDRTLPHCASSSADTAWCDISVTRVSIHTAEV